MTPDQVKSSYLRSLGDRVTVRRYSGTGTARPKTDVDNVRARVTNYGPQEIVGTIMEGDRQVIVYADDVGALNPLTLRDKLVVRGRELAIMSVDDNTRRVGGVLIAYELQVRG